MSTTRIHIGRRDHGRAMTLEEFREADEAPGYRYELAGGVLEVTEVPGDDHGQVLDNFHEAFSNYRRIYPGLILRLAHGSECRLWIPGMASGRNPDFAVILRGTPKDERGRRTPEFVAEVVSPGGEARDYVAKRAEYLRFGIKEYWIVDPQLRQITVLVRDDTGPEPRWDERVFHNDETAVSALLPQFELHVAALWVGVEFEDVEGGE